MADETEARAELRVLLIEQAELLAEMHKAIALLAELRGRDQQRLEAIERSLGDAEMSRFAMARQTREIWEGLRTFLGVAQGVHERLSQIELRLLTAAGKPSGET